MKTVPATIPANEYEFHSVLVTTFQEHSIYFLCIIFNVVARKKEEKNISLRMYTWGSEEVIRQCRIGD